MYSRCCPPTRPSTGLTRSQDCAGQPPTGTCAVFTRASAGGPAHPRRRGGPASMTAAPMHGGHLTASRAQATRDPGTQSGTIQLPDPAAGGHHLVPRPCPGHHEAERVRGHGGALHHHGPGQRARRPAYCRHSRSTTSRSSSRTGASTRTARSSTTWPPTRSRTRRCTPSGSPSSSATRSW